MRKGIDDLKSLLPDEPFPYDLAGNYIGGPETEAEYIRRREAYADKIAEENNQYIRRLRIAGEYGKEATTSKDLKMKIEIDIPIALASLVMSFDVEELNDDKIISDFEGSEHYYELLSYGLITASLNEDEDAEYHLTYLGRLVYERRSKFDYGKETQGN